MNIVIDVLFILLAVLVIFFIFGAVGLMAAYPILAPVLDLKKQARPRRQFTTADLLWLMLMLQYPLIAWGLITTAMADPYDPTRGPRMALPVAIPAFVAIIYCWIRGTGILSSLGVWSAFKRGAFLVIAFPLAILTPVAAEYLIFSPAAPAVFSLPLLILAGNLTTRWVIRGRAIEAPEPDIERGPTEADRELPEAKPSDDTPDDSWQR